MNLVEAGPFRLEVLHLPAVPHTSRRAPLLFLHEGLGSVAMWRDWPAQLVEATGRDGWVYSRRGYGNSQSIPDVRGPTRHEGWSRIGRLPPDYLQHEAFVVLPDLMKQLPLSEQPVLVGHSDGGSIALLYASRSPVAACVVMAPHVMVEDGSIAAIQQARQAYLDGGLRDRLLRYHSDVDCAFWQWNDAWLNPAFRAFDIRSDCKTIEAPVLAIQGFDDPYGSMRQIDEILPDNATVQREKIVRCGHSPHRDQTQTTTGLITAFLSQRP